jgi:isoamylase
MLPSGGEFGEEHWQNDGERSFGVILNGEEIPDRDARGQRIVGDSLMLLLHFGDVPITWTVPAGWEAGWNVVLDTDDPEGERDAAPHRPGEQISVPAHSLTVLVHPTPCRPSGD